VTFWPDFVYRNIDSTVLLLYPGNVILLSKLKLIIEMKY